MCGVSGTGGALKEVERGGGGTMASVQGLRSPGWEEQRMDRWKKAGGMKERMKMEKE